MDCTTEDPDAPFARLRIIEDVSDTTSKNPTRARSSAPSAIRPTKGPTTVTRGISIAVESMYVPDRSSPRDDEFYFTYHVTIANEGTETAQLVSREWVITDAEGEVERVKGPGVVGKQPVLAPGTTFEYSSFCPLRTSVGSMQGSYQMVTGDGEQFDAVIAPFTLAMPNALN